MSPVALNCGHNTLGQGHCVTWTKSSDGACGPFIGNESRQERHAAAVARTAGPVVKGRREMHKSTFSFAGGCPSADHETSYTRSFASAHIGGMPSDKINRHDQLDKISYRGGSNDTGSSFYDTDYNVEHKRLMPHEQKLRMLRIEAKQMDSELVKGVFREEKQPVYSTQYGGTHAYFAYLRGSSTTKPSFKVKDTQDVINPLTHDFQYTKRIQSKLPSIRTTFARNNRIPYGSSFLDDDI